MHCPTPIHSLDPRQQTLFFQNTNPTMTLPCRLHPQNRPAFFTVWCRSPRMWPLIFSGCEVCVILLLLWSSVCALKCALSLKCQGSSKHSFPASLSWAPASVSLSAHLHLSPLAQPKSAHHSSFSSKPPCWGFVSSCSFLPSTWQHSGDTQCLFNWPWPTLSFRTQGVRSHGCLN